MKTKTINIIVPVYNTELYLERCIESIIAQSFTDYELLLIDDGSSDRSGAICDYYANKDDRIKVIHKENEGASRARNVGLEHSTGAYITFIDSDDYVEEHWLEELYNAMISSKADLVYANYDRVNESGIVFERSNNIEKHVNLANVEDRVQYILETLSGRIGWEVWNRLFKGAIIREKKIRFCETCSDFAEDMGFVLSYILYCSSVFSTGERGYKYCVRNASIMRSKAESIMFDSLNEVSKTLYNQFIQLDCKDSTAKMYPIIHFAVMYNQYRKLLQSNRLPHLKNELSKIKDAGFYKKQTKKLFSLYPELTQAVGKSDAQRILLFSSFCLHRNYKLYSYISAIYYRWIWKR